MSIMRQTFSVCLVGTFSSSSSRGTAAAGSTQCCSPHGFNRKKWSMRFALHLDAPVLTLIP
jgi:hypothetical protein